MASSSLANSFVKFNYLGLWLSIVGYLIPVWVLAVKHKVNFVFEFSILPKEKVSALRGGMGEMLLRQNCIGMRDCKNCSFEEACIVRNTVYTRMKRKPAFMQGDDSIGYLLECENARTDFKAGEEKILENQTAHMKNYRIETVGAYLEKEF